MALDAEPVDLVRDRAHDGLDSFTPAVLAKQQRSTPLDPGAARCHRRCAPAAAGDLEPAVERHEVHPGRGTDYGASSTTARIGRLKCRSAIPAWGSTRLPALRLRSVPAGRQQHDAQARRTRARPRAVRHLVEAHGGTITASSDGLGKGATIRVTLPARERRLESGNEGESGSEDADRAVAL